MSIIWGEDKLNVISTWYNNTEQKMNRSTATTRMNPKYIMLRERNQSQKLLITTPFCMKDWVDKSRETEVN